MEKRCSNCRETLPAQAFYRNRSKPDGLQEKCKPCHKKYTAALLGSDSGRARRKQHLSNYAKTAGFRASQRRYKETAQGKAMAKRQSERITETGQGAAYQRVYKATRAGKIQRKRLCSRCGMAGRTIFHHPAGYKGDNALNVVELCYACHEWTHHV